MKKKKKKGLLNFSRLESLLILALSIVFLFWAGLKCKKGQMDVLSPKPKVEKTTNQPLIKPEKKIPNKKGEPSELKPINRPTKESYTKLYVIVDSLKVRRGPHLDSSVVARVPAGETVDYLEERTDFKQEINMNDVVHNVPWVKVKTKKGRIGWIYSAGVQFYK